MNEMLHANNTNKKNQEKNMLHKTFLYKCEKDREKENE